MKCTLAFVFELQKSKIQTFCQNFVFCGHNKCGALKGEFLFVIAPLWNVIVEELLLQHTWLGNVAHASSCLSARVQVYGRRFYPQDRYCAQHICTGLHVHVLWWIATFEQCISEYIAYVLILLTASTASGSCKVQFDKSMVVIRYKGL